MQRKMGAPKLSQRCPKGALSHGWLETTVPRAVLQNYPDITLRGGEKQLVPGRGMAGTGQLDLLVAEETGIRCNMQKPGDLHVIHTALGHWSGQSQQCWVGMAGLRPAGFNRCRGPHNFQPVPARWGSWEVLKIKNAK